MDSPNKYPDHSLLGDVTSELRFEILQDTTPKHEYN